MTPDPETRDQWQLAADAAQGALAMSSARAYGLISGGPAVNEKRCNEILERAKAEHGIAPSHDAIERFAVAALHASHRNGTSA